MNSFKTIWNMNIFQMACENNLEEEQEELQTRQRSDKRNPSPKQKRNLRKHLWPDPP